MKKRRRDRLNKLRRKKEIESKPSIITSRMITSLATSASEISYSSLRTSLMYSLGHPLGDVAHRVAKEHWLWSRGCIKNQRTL